MLTEAVEGQDQRMPEIDRLTPKIDRLALVVNPAVGSPVVAVTIGGGTRANLGGETTIGGDSRDEGRGNEDMHDARDDRDGGDDNGSVAVCRDPTNGKQPADVGGSERRGPGEPVLDPSIVTFIVPTGSLAYQPIYYADFAKFVGEEQLARLGQMNRALLEAVLRMRQEHV